MSKSVLEEVPSKPRAIISFTAGDADSTVAELSQLLHERGIDAYLAEKELGIGPNLLDDVFSQGLASADAFIIVLSKNSVRGPWMQRDLGVAAIHRIASIVKRIITVTLDGISPPPSLAATLWIPVNHRSDIAEVANRITLTIAGASFVSRPIESASRSVPGLPSLEPDVERLFAALCDHLIESRPYHSILSAQEILAAGITLDLAERQIWISVSVLEQHFYLTDVEYAFGDSHPAHARVTFVGFDRFLKAYYPVEYKRDLAAILMSVVNRGQYSQKQIANSLDVSEAIVAHVFQFLERSGYATVSKHSGGATLRPRATIQRALDELLAVAGSDQLYVQRSESGYAVYSLGDSEPILEAPTQEIAIKLAKQLNPESLIHVEQVAPSDRFSAVEDNQLSNLRELRAASPERLEVDLRSTSPIILLRGAALPQLSVWLRATNHADYNVRIIHITMQVWFGQPTAKLSSDRPVVVPANSTINDISLTEIIDGEKLRYVENFLASENFGKAVYLYLALACDAPTGPFTKEAAFERREPEISAIIR